MSSNGINYRYAVFRILFINDTNEPSHVDLRFPHYPISLLPDSTIVLSVFLLPEKYTPETIKDTFNFGLELEAFFESDDRQEFEYKSSIEPQKQTALYVGMLFDPKTANGVTRSQLAVEGHDESLDYPVESTVYYHINDQPLNLYYGISFDAPNNYVTIPCGQVQLK